MLFSGSNCDLMYTTLGTPYRGIALLQTKVLFRNQARMLNYPYNTWIRNQCLVYNNDLAWQAAIPAKKLLGVHRDCSSQVDHTLNIELQFSSELNLFFFHTIHRYSAQDKLIFYMLHVNVRLLLYIFNCKYTQFELLSVVYSNTLGLNTTVFTFEHFKWKKIQ